MSRLAIEVQVIVHMASHVKPCQEQSMSSRQKMTEAHGETVLQLKHYTTTKVDQGDEAPRASKLGTLLKKIHYVKIL